MMRTAVLAATLLCLVAGATLASAHHSGAMFDGQKSLTLSGIVKAFQWTNPHCWIQLLVTEHEDAVEWSIEMGSPTQMYRSGWRPGTLKAGDRITIVIHPTRDGSRGGSLLSATSADGTPLVATSREGSAKP